MSHLILLTGGVRSGKSAQAERILADSPEVLYIATARCLDGEMAQGDVLLDCVTNMVTNLMLDEEPEYDHLPRARVEEIGAHIEKEIARLLIGLEQRSGLAVLVTGEVGLGLVAPYRMGRIFADILGKVNQQLAARADEAYFMACGLPIRLK